ncbi:MAG: hypothetical protein PWQ67_1133 [Clostridia bacterium]|jgi:hypothetical protein|nr:hypothetical protein [Clostridia bacterium]MDN5322679.1 hypothetical protein [Clostridia bacterium]
MSDKNKPEQQIKAGPLPVDPETGLSICPPPLEIDIIKVKKVFNECMHTQVEEMEIIGWTASNTRDAEEANCESVTVSNKKCQVLNGDVVRVTFDLEVCATVPLDTGGFERRCRTVTGITKTLSVERAGEEGLEVQCDIFPECLFCFISNRDSAGGVLEVTCCVGILILIKVEAEVQLLIPTFGYPPPPPECGEFLGQCPSDFVPDWPPYPPQGLIRGGKDKKPKGCK